MNSRLSSIQTILKKENVDALLISSPAHIIYLTSYAGFSSYEREAYLLITPQENFIFTDGRYSEAVKELIPSFTLIERTSTFPELFKAIIKDLHLTSLGFEENNLTVSEHASFSHYIDRLEPVSMDFLRRKKDNEEIQKIQQACTIGDEAFTHITSNINEGMTEKDIALELELFIRKKGAHLSFPTIAAFGKNSAVPHHHTSDQRLKTNDIILLDFGILYENYCSDMTRTIFLGEPPEEQRNVYNTVLKSQQKAIDYINEKLKQNKKQHLKASEVDNAARDYIISQGYPSIPHSLGHGIGIEVHESPTISPRSKQVLSDGMVFSIEPGIYIPGKFGIRIEDLFTIQNRQLIQLTKAPHNLIVLN